MDTEQRAFEGLAKAKLTYADFLLFPDDGQRHELIDGEHYVTASPNLQHQRLSIRLSTDLAIYFRANPIGEVFHAPFDCVMSDFDVVEPDVLVVLNDQKEILTALNIRGAPAIVVEILSPSTRRVDQRIKRSLYERAGVREYWIVDPVALEINVQRRKPTGELHQGELLETELDSVLTSSLLPGFNLRLRELFR